MYKVKNNEQAKDEKTILIINPRAPDGCGKSYYLPLGLLYLASICEKAGYKPVLLDFNIYKPYLKQNPDNWCDELLKEKILEIKPKNILLGCLFSGQFPQVMNFAAVIKKGTPDCKILLGGMHATTYTKEILENCLDIDYIVISEGEQTLENYLSKNDKGDSNYSDLNGFAYRNADGIVKINPIGNYIECLDSIPKPAYNIVNIHDYYIETIGWHNPKSLDIKMSVPIITSRGCPLKCNFCPMSSVMGKAYRQRSVENVISEIKYLYHTHNLNYFSFMDDNLTLNKKYVLKFCQEIIDNNLNIQFDLLNGIMVNSVDEEVAEALVNAGLVRVALAIESGSPFIRKNVVGKNLSQKKIYEVIDIFKKYPNVITRAFFIIGFPEDTHETLNETYKMIKEIGISSPEVNNIIPFQGTRLFEQALKDDLFYEKYDVNDLWKTPISFTKTNEEDSFFLKNYNLSLEEMVLWRKKFDKIIN